MITIDLVTGFLGSGKTTFLRSYVPFLEKKGEKICILENDHGPINVDTMLLSDLTGEKVGLEMVAGGCDYDCHRRRLKTRLITMAMLGYQRVVMEPSGVFDIDEFFDILHEDPLEGRYQIGSVICIVRADLEEKASETMDYLLASQCASAGALVLSCTESAGEAKIQRTLAHVDRALASIHAKRSFEKGRDLFCKPFEALGGEDLERIAGSGHRNTSFEKRFSMDESGIGTLFFMHLSLSLSEIRERTGELFSDPAFGKVLRVKGFCEEKGDWFEINGTPENLTVSQVATGQTVLIVIGEALAKERISALFPSVYSSQQVERSAKEAFVRNGGETGETAKSGV